MESQKNLIEPFGGELVNLFAAPEEREMLSRYAANLPRLQLSRRGVCDLELLANGGFSPLRQFMNKGNYLSVLETARLADGTLFPLPVTLSVKNDFDLKLDSEVALADQKNNLLAVMRVEEIYEWSKEYEARQAYGTNDARHPQVAEMNALGELNIAGKLRVITMPPHYDFADLRLSPLKTREALTKLGNYNVVAFQTRNPLHRAHEEMTKRAAAEIGGTLLLHPVIGVTKPGDIDQYTRVRTYRILTNRYYNSQKTVLALLPLAMRMAGPRSALWHGIIRRNYGANHFIVGRDHASPGVDSAGKPFYGTFAAQEFFAGHSEEIGVKMSAFEEMVYLPDENRYEETSKTAGKKIFSLSGTQVRENYLHPGRALPEWFTRPEIAEILQQTHPPMQRQGFCIWLTGLSGSGKSTTAEALTVKLLELGRQITLLDGDVVRTNLSRGLGFSKEDRDINVRRIGFVASEIVRHGGGVICAAVSPYRATRGECRVMIGSHHFIEVFVDTPLEVCEKRDTKGMYALARKGKIKNFTGIDDPYEVPHNPEIIIDTTARTAGENADRILSVLFEKGFLTPVVVQTVAAD